jgi:hypothetical protein
MIAFLKSIICFLKGHFWADGAGGRWGFNPRYPDYQWMKCRRCGVYKTRWHHQDGWWSSWMITRNWIRAGDKLT